MPVCMYTHIDARVGFFFVVFLVIYMIIYICYLKVCSVTTLTAPTFASFPLYATSLLNIPPLTLNSFSPVLCIGIPK